MLINNNIEEFINNINRGKLVCFKTDTIWGLSANSNNTNAIQNLYKFKNRSLDKPFIFLIKKNQNLKELVSEIPLEAQKLIDKFWCGPLTIIFKAQNNLSILRPYKNKSTIAIRMPDDEITQQILSKLNYPLPSTSVNLEGQEPINIYIDIIKKFSDKDIYILNPNNKNYLLNKNLNNYNVSPNSNNNLCNINAIQKDDINLNCVNKETNYLSFNNQNSKIKNNNPASTIVSFANGKLEIIREGAISKDEIFNALKN